MHPVRLTVMTLVLLLFVAGTALLVQAVSPGEHVWPFALFAMGIVLLLGLIIASLAATNRERDRGPENRAARRRTARRS